MQQIIILSTTKVEYMEVTFATCQAVWLRRMLTELKHEQKGPTKILYDNKSTIVLTMNLMFYSRSKHISIKFHHIKELVKNEEIEIEFCLLEEQDAYIFTKPLKSDHV